MRGSQTETTLGTGVVDLYQQGMPELAGLVLLTAILAPAVHLGMLLHLTLPLRLGRVPWGLNPSFRLMRRIQPWSMMEVFMLGILVSVVKLAAMGRIVPGLALYAFGVLILVLAAANASFDPRSLWRRVEELS
jgi:paraquat-inducible protein A